MNIKIIILSYNDILYNSLSNLVLQREAKIEIVKVPLDKLNPKDNLIILDSITSFPFVATYLKMQ